MKGSIRVPKEYFLKMAKADYNDYREALAREFLQNSLDASATSIYIDTRNEWIIVQDDGLGMDRDTILNKLLVLGGTKKVSGAVGAFGKAKELLYFSWEEYEIRTGNLVVTGAGAEFEIVEVNDRVDGVIASIRVPNDSERQNLVYAFHTVGSRIQTSAKIYVESTCVECEYLRGVEVKDLGWASIHRLEKTDDSYVHFRVNGIWMFSTYVGQVEKMGTIVVELKSSSVDCLTSNRDGLKMEYRQQCDEFLRKLIVDTKSALKPKNNVVRKLIKGDGAVSVIGEEALAMAGMKGSITEAVKELEEVLKSGLGEINMEVISMRIKNELKSLDDNSSTCFEEYKERFAFMGYKPDFILKYDEITQSNLVERHKKSRNANIFAKAWTEILKQLMLDNGIYEQFTAGFTYDEKEEAAYEKKDGRHVFYLNPLLILKSLGMEKAPLKRKAFAARDLLDKAIHEVAHMFHNDHNESFVLKMHNLNAHTYDSMPVYHAAMKVTEKTDTLTS